MVAEQTAQQIQECYKYPNQGLGLTRGGQEPAGDSPRVSRTPGFNCTRDCFFAFKHDHQMYSNSRFARGGVCAQGHSLYFFSSFVLLKFPDKKSKSQFK